MSQQGGSYCPRPLMRRKYLYLHSWYLGTGRYGTQCRPKVHEFLHVRVSSSLQTEPKIKC